MFRPLASLLHRSGIFSYLRLGWRRDDSELRDELKAELARQVGDATATLTETVTDLRRRQGELRREVRQLNAVVTANSGRPLDRHRHALDFDAVARHSSAAIRSAPFDMVPMPHLLIENLLPEATYRALVESTPPDECFPDRDRLKQNFKPSQGPLMPEFTAAMWTFLEDNIISRVLAPALIERFQPHVDRVYRDRYGERGADVSGLRHEATAGRLMLRRPGYHLEPHLDPQRVIVTCLIYFARPEDDASFGTQLFSVTGLSRVGQSKTYYPREGGHECALAKTVPFTPNTAVAFLNAGAAHGATIPDSAPPETKRYAYQFYISPEPRSLAEVIGERADESADLA